jgi:hypothetical protein
VASEGRVLRLAPADPARARGSHAEALAARGMTATRLPLDEGTSYRLHLAGLPPRARATVRYRYSAPLACHRGRFVLRVPGSLEADPVAADVTVSVAASSGARVGGLELAGVPASSGATRARGRAPARAAWEVSFAVRPSGRAEPVLAAVAPAGGRSPDSVVALGVCRQDAAAEAPAPERVMLVIDRSRSVGAAGISLERDLARALLEGLPPSVRFNAVFFDRAAAPLFPLSRAATEEALDALAGQAIPGQLENGTDLPRALETAARLVRQEGEARTWLVLITDGAVPEGERGEALLAATASLPPARTEVLVLLVRPPGDEPAPAPAQEVLRSLPARHGGVLRAIDPADLRGSVSEVVASARRGGDLFAISVAAGGKRTEVLPAVPPGAGQTRVLRVPGAAAFTLAGRRGGQAWNAPLGGVRLPAAALAPHQGGGAAARTATTPRLAAWVEPAAPAPPLADDIPRGQMDRQVVRNALSLAYMPRARACYLGRRVRTAADFELRGRLRLELHLERGEMVEAVVRNSTLDRPEIEACLREAAFGVEIPRPLHRDAPVVAALNLLFQPRTPPAGSRDASAVAREIDLLLGPISFPSDPHELLDTPASP